MALTVVAVIDGDTIDLSDGSRVRLLGIDTPERGECGFEEAGRQLEALVGGRAVQIVAGGRDSEDRYGRLLRYVDVDGTDAGLELIRAGRAIARYDSRDGYGWHPREDTYVEADRISPAADGCRDRSGAEPPDDGRLGAGDGADPRFGSCAEASAAGYGPYTRGSLEYDWYRDGDGDGVVCE